jgi:hypothetical protein
MIGDIEQYTDSSAVNERMAFIQEGLSVRDKHDLVVPFQLNFVQRHILVEKQRAFDSGRAPRFLILKARRMGVTTLEQGLNFFDVVMRENKEVITLAHDADATEKIFRIANLFYERFPEADRPARLTSHNKRELNLPRRNSIFSIATAGSHAPARGGTLSRVHWSEVAWSPGDIFAQRGLLAGLTEAASDGSVTLESTPNGVGNLFHQLCADAAKGVGPWTLIFIPWFRDPSYSIPLTDEAARALEVAYTDEEKHLVTRHALTPSQVAWRRAKIADLTVGGDARLFAQEYPEDIETCFLVSGLHFFEITALDKIGSVGAPISQRGVTGDRPGTGGVVEIYVEPVKGRAFCIGCDVAGGGASGNESYAAVLDVETCEQVAALHGRWLPETFGAHAADLAHYYGDALLAVEANNHGHSTLNTLRNVLHYPNLYCLVDYRTGQKADEPGWKTDGRTRPLMLGELRQGVEQGWMKIRDGTFLAQCRTFKLDRDEEKYKAAPGCHDDSVIAWAIAIQARKDRQPEPEVTGPSTAGQKAGVFTGGGHRRIF